MTANRVTNGVVLTGALAVCLLTLLTVLIAPALARPKPGDLDRSFGTNGKATTAIDSRSMANAVTIDSHRRIVAVGATNPPYNGAFALARYRPDGSLDRSFGTRGTVTTDFGGYDGASSVAIDSHGRIVVAGQYTNGGPNHPGFAIASYKPDGTLDGSFGEGGKVTTPFGGRASAVAIDDQGRIVAGGRASADPYGRFSDFALARYKSNGDPDPSFGNGGEVTTDFDAGWETIYSLAIDSRGRIVAAGDRLNTALDKDSFALARYRPDGSLDGSFAAGGKLTTSFSGDSTANSVAIDSRGWVVAAGKSAKRQPARVRFALARYRANGSLDGSFSGNGKATTSFGRHGGGASAVAIDSRGRIVVTGGAFDLARYRSNGNLDHSFGKRGKVATGFGAVANALAIDSRHRLVVAGGHAKFTVARYIGSRRR